MAAIMLDLDNFKVVNDRKGHAMGDQVLRSVAETISARIRLTDSLYRYGGDEFVVLASSATRETARNLAEELRSLIAESLEALNLPVTVSLGVAECSLDEAGNDWLARADGAMYLAKQRGKNQVEVALPHAQVRQVA